MKVRTSELTGPALDWAVAQVVHADLQRTYGEPVFDPKTKRIYQTQGLRQIGVNYSPSTNWAQGGLLIEQEGISLRYLPITDDPFRWVATEKPSMKHPKPQGVYGPTPLIAAMRCFVASNLGDTVEVPYELV